MFFRKQSQDFGAGDPPCTGYRNAARGDLTNCDNWFRYWSSSDDSANMHNRTNAAPTEWIYRGGDYNGDQFGASSPWGDFGGATFPYVALYNSASMSCAFNIILPPGGPAQINFNNKGNGTDCVEDTIGHELGHVLIKRLWNTPQAAGGWQGLTDTDNDRIPDGIENGSLLYNGLNYSTLGFNPNNANSIPGFPYGNDEEVFGEIQGWGRTGTHANDWANPGKQSNPPYKRIIVENGTDATLNGTYVDYAIDTNSNGLFDYLIIGVWVNVLDPGTYTVFGNIYNNGNMLWAKNFTYLQPGMQLVLLKFDGLLIRKYRTVGTFNLTDITIFNKNSVDEDTSLNKSVYTTSFYNYTQFEKPAAGYTGSFSDHGVDVNGNGLYDYLIVTTWIDVAESGNYTIEGNIESKSKTVATSQNNSYLMPGIHAIDLVFDGSEIRTHRKNGSYTLGLLRAMNNSYDELDVLYNYYNTSTYTYTQFEKTKAEFTGSFTDFGVDTDGDGLYNYLSLNAEVDTDSSGVYSISAHLLDSNSTEITWNSSTVNLTAGIQIISLNFDGISISNHKVDGHYMVSALDLEDEEGSAVSHVLDSFKTSAYNYIQFEPTPATSTGAITRRISPSLIQPGSTLNITLTPSPSSLFVSPGYHVIETIPQGFTFAGTSGGYSNQGNVYTFDRMGSDPFVYTLTAPHANGSYTISGTFMDDNGNMGTISGTTTIRVGGIYYDLNGDGRIERSEAIQAVTDYFSGIITRQDAINVVMAYFIG